VLESENKMRPEQRPPVLLLGLALFAVGACGSNHSTAGNNPDATPPRNPGTAGASISDASGSAGAGIAGQLGAAGAPPDGAAAADAAGEAATAPPDGGAGNGLHAIGGTVSGLSSTLVLANGDDRLTISSNGTFVFSGKASSYSVSVDTPPSAPRQSCTVTNDASGVALADVTDVEVDCAPFVVAGGLNNPSGLSFAGSNLFFSSMGGLSCADIGTPTHPQDGIMTVAASGGQPALIAPLHGNTSVCGGAGTVVDAGHVYWYDAGDATIYRATLGGADPTPVFYTALSSIQQIAVDPGGRWIFYNELPAMFGQQGGIGRVAVDGTGNTMFAYAGATNSGLAVDDKDLYWTDPSAGTVNKVPLDAALLPAMPTFVATNEATPWSPAVTPSTLYWIQIDAAARESPLAASSPSYLTMGPMGLTGLVADASFVWAIATAGQPIDDAIVYKIPAGGGAPVIVAKHLYEPRSITMDATHIYVATLSTIGGASPDPSDGTILMIVK
jgi:hypothetical protein